MRGILLLALIVPLAVRAQVAPPPSGRPAVVSTSTLTVSGPAVGGARTIALPFMNNYENKGDWYVTPTDAHAAFFLADAVATKEGRLDLRLNGKQASFVITRDNNKDTGHKGDQEFGVLLGSAQKSTYYTLGKDDAVTITVSQMDARSFEATAAGTLTEVGAAGTPGRLQVSAVIKLSRASAPAEKSAGTYQDCDPVIHDWLNEAQDRAPSDCEVTFDQHVRTAVVRAVEPLVASFTAGQWRPTTIPTAGPLTSVARGSEPAPYVFGSAGGDLRFQLDLDPRNPEYLRLKAAADAPDPGLTRVMELMKQGKYAEAQAAQKEVTPNHALADLRDNTQLNFTPRINSGGLRLLNFHGAYAATPLAGGGTVLYLPDAQPASGGASGDAMTYVLLGPWGRAGAAPSDGEATRVAITAPLNPKAPRLSVQTIVISFRCSQDLAQKAIQTIDWSALRAVIAEH